MKTSGKSNLGFMEKSWNLGEWKPCSWRVVS